MKLEAKVLNVKQHAGFQTCNVHDENDGSFYDHCLVHPDTKGIKKGDLLCVYSYRASLEELPRARSFVVSHRNQRPSLSLKFIRKYLGFTDEEMKTQSRFKAFMKWVW